MDIHSVLQFLHNIGSAAEGSGSGGILPGIFGGAVGSFGGFMEKGVRNKINEQQQQQQEQQNQKNNDQVNNRMKDLF